MTKEEAVESVENMGRFLDRMLERLDEDAAKKLESTYKKLKELVNAGKLEEAQKVRSEMFQRRRR